MLLNNRYSVIQTLGGGGFGETFLAEDTQMPSNRRCVVKQLRPIQNNPQVYQLVQERFQREAAILEDLGGTVEQIPTLYAYFQSEGIFYLVQEWVEGDTLTKKIYQQGIFSESAVREILINLLPVLDYVHSKRIVHRDIKPDNIIIRHRDGKPVLIDFGAVRESMGTVVNSQGSPTSSIVIGTPGYMPSEQAAGRPVYSSDLYSLGMTAIYLLTGKQPQDLETDPRTGEIVWRKFALSVSPTLAEVLDRAIAYHPRERFATAREMLEALQFGAVGVPPTAAYTQPPIANTQPYQQPPAATTPTYQQPPIANNQPYQPSPPLPNTVAVSPGNTPQPANQTSNNQSSNKGGIILASVLASGLIGASIIIAFAMNNRSSQTVPQANNSISSSSESSSNSSSESSANTQETTPPETQETTPPETTPETNQIDRQTPEQSVINYYENINQGEYEASWSLLSPSLQNNQKLHPQGYRSYLDWWGGKVQTVNLQQVTLVENSGNSATVEVALNYSLKNGEQSSGSVRFYLLWDASSNQWIVSDVN